MFSKAFNIFGSLISTAVALTPAFAFAKTAEITCTLTDSENNAVLDKFTFTDSKAYSFEFQQKGWSKPTTAFVQISDLSHKEFGNILVMSYYAIQDAGNESGVGGISSLHCEKHPERCEYADQTKRHVDMQFVLERRDEADDFAPLRWLTLHCESPRIEVVPQK